MSVIAISRGSLLATRKLVEGLKARLQYKVISREEVIDAAGRYGIEETGLGEKDIMEMHPPGYWHERSNERAHYLTCFKTALLDFAVEGSIIYHGNLAHILLNEVPFVLRVRVNAPLGDRVKMLMEEEGISRERAFEKIKDMDNRRRLWTQFLYDAEVIDPIFFDLVLNLERIRIDDAIEMVVTEIAKDPFRPTEKSLKILKDLHLACIVKTHLMRSAKTMGLDLDVDADSSTGKIIVSGSLPPDAHQTREADIQSVLSGVESVKNVEVKVKFG
nr:cytidylate kinase-like family protein [candidate division Zixibacteria bacterium]